MRGLRLAVVLTLFALAAGAVPRALLAQPPGGVVVVPIRGAVDDGTARLVARAIDDAKAADARAIVLDVDSVRGLPGAALEIDDALAGAGIPVDAYVRRASSAATLVALGAQRIAVAPGAEIGPADPPDAAAAQVEERAAAAAATRTGRDPKIAAALVDGGVDLPALKPPGTPLALDAAQARAAGLATAIAPAFGDALRAFDLGDAPRVDVRSAGADRFAHLATLPWISALLLAIGFLGLLIELQTLHGIAGLVGAAALAAFFGAHVIGGYASPADGALALAALLAIGIELHVVPGHGVAGILGVVALVAAIVLAFGLPLIVVGVQALGLAIVIAAIGFVLAQRIVPDNAFVRRIAFAGAQGADYVAAADHRALLGAGGTAISFLRPSGIATFGERRVDVLSEGPFVPAGTPVRVTRVEGARIFVRPEEDS